MLSERVLLVSVLQCVLSLAPVLPMTSYTQVNHDEPTNADKETTITTEQDEFRAPGVGEKDLLWDHVGDLTQHFVLGVEERTTTKGFDEVNSTAMLVNQIENSVNVTNLSQFELNISSVNKIKDKENEILIDTPNLLPTSGIEVVGAEEDDRFNRSVVQGKLILYPTDHIFTSHYSSTSALGNISKDLWKGSMLNRTSNTHHQPQKITFDTSDPFSVIFGVVKTRFKTDQLINISIENRENIIGGLAVRKVEELFKKEDSEKSTVLGKEATTTFKNINMHKFQEEENQFGSGEDDKITHHSEKFEFGKVKSSPHEKVMFSKYDIESNTSEENNEPGHFNDELNDNNLFKEWDTVSEEQEKMLEDMALQSHKHLEGSTRDALPPAGRWFILLLAGNSTIVKLRQKDFAKYLKLNLAARLSLEYDEVKVNRVVLAPPRLMVNVSVIPSNEGNNNQDLDEEIDLEDKIFGEEEAPLHKLAETNATLLELSGEEYHVVRFLSLRSQQPIQLEDSPSATSTIVNDRHMDIEMVIYVAVGGTCAIAILLTFFFAIYRYLRTVPINLPWKGSKPLFVAPWSLPRHQRMGEEPVPSIGGPLTVIYSGNFVDRAAPSSGSWIDDYQPPSLSDAIDIPRQQPVYGFGALSNTALPEICDSYSTTVQESPRLNHDSKLHILGCRPNHFLLPHQPSRINNDHKNMLDVRIQGVGVDNPNYQS